MQPTFRQVPPWVARFTTTAVIKPELGCPDRATHTRLAGADDDEVVGHAISPLPRPALPDASIKHELEIEMAGRPGHDADDGCRD
jgi:hypothetical protein